jgi:hypothetical protein
VIDLLRRLQEADSALDKARLRVAEIERILSDRAEVRQARDDRDSAAGNLAALEVQRRDAELEIESRRVQLAQLEQRLYGGRAGDAREVKNLDLEAKQHRSLIASREERLLELLESIETAQSSHRDTEATLADLVSARRKLEADLRKEHASIVDAAKRHQDGRAKLRERIAPATLRTYDHLRQSREGLAVAPVIRSTCAGCRVNLTAAVEQRVRAAAALVACPNCGRLLHMPTS